MEETQRIFVNERMHTYAVVTLMRNQKVKNIPENFVEEKTRTSEELEKTGYKLVIQADTLWFQKG